MFYPQELRVRWMNLKNLIKQVILPNQNDKDDQQHVMTEEEKLDETLEESFPASDPPGHFSKSAEDKNMH